MLCLTRAKKPAFEPGFALPIDGTHRLEGRLAKPAKVWKDRLLPALETIAQACEQHALGHSIIAEGLCALPAAVAFGATFLTTRRLPLGWQQVSPNRPRETWSLAQQAEPPGFSAQIILASTSANDIAVLVSVASKIEAAFGVYRAHLPAFRGIVSISKSGNSPHDIETPGQAADIVRIIAEGLRKARDSFQPRGTVHLFLAVPAGLAVMIGQSLNTFGPIQTYEHIGLDAVGKYEPAVQLEPSS
jgi:hypothetical protein